MRKKLFKPGDTVELKSGSISMTVVRYDLSSKKEEKLFIVCVTWLTKGSHQIGKYDEDMLQKSTLPYWQRIINSNA